jgi:hypothetical protein
MQCSKGMNDKEKAQAGIIMLHSAKATKLKLKKEKSGKTKKIKALSLITGIYPILLASRVEAKKHRITGITTTTIAREFKLKLI